MGKKNNKIIMYGSKTRKTKPVVSLNKKLPEGIGKWESP